MDYKDAFASAMITNTELSKELTTANQRIAELESNNTSKMLQSQRQVIAELEKRLQEAEGLANEVRFYLSCHTNFPLRKALDSYDKAFFKEKPTIRRGGGGGGQ